jgi:hypothetical protein
MKKPESSCVTDETRLMDLIFSCAKEELESSLAPSERGKTLGKRERQKMLSADSEFSSRRYLKTKNRMAHMSSLGESLNHIEADQMTARVAPNDFSYMHGWGRG